MALPDGSGRQLGQRVGGRWAAPTDRADREYSVDRFDLLRVRDVMDREPPPVPAAQTVAQAAEAIRRGEPLYCRRRRTRVELGAVVRRGPF